ncbi:MAG TPA: DUF533 domain-containing protein [Candidatus Avisuccinivibrio pullicola]|nr:DUF533 domain-containing protein [Candidatus Avisuccinivibrio pullicola]
MTAVYYALAGQDPLPGGSTEHTEEGSYPFAARESHCVFYSDRERLEELTDPLSRIVAGFALTVFEKWLRRRSAHVYTLKGAPEERNGFYVDDASYTDCACLLIETMIFAARADGHIDGRERESMYRFYKTIFPHDDLRGSIDRLLTGEVNLDELISRVRFREEALDIYELSSLVLQGRLHFIEQGYLEELASSLAIDPSLRDTLDGSARERLKATELQSA